MQHTSIMISKSRPKCIDVPRCEMPSEFISNNTNENITELWTSSWTDAENPPEYEDMLHFKCKHDNYKMTIEGTDLFCKYISFCCNQYQLGNNAILNNLFF